MAVFGWFVIFCITCYVWFVTYGGIRVSLGFTGRVGGEVWFFLVIALVLSTLCWWSFPFEVSLK